MEDTRPIWITGVGVLAVYFGENFLNSRRKVIVWADAVGLALFAVAGAQKAYLETGDPLISVMMGVATAVAGGIIRDIIANEIPLILQQEVYATAAFCGAFVYMALTLAGFDFIWLQDLALPQDLWSGPWPSGLDGVCQNERPVAQTLES